jgi:multiple sugar transport system substrate-binding protein
LIYLTIINAMKTSAPTSKVLTLALLLTLPFVLTACTLKDLPLIGQYFGGSGAPSGPVTLNMWGLWESPPVMNSLIAKYRETHPNVTINYDDRSVIRLDDYKETVYTRASQADAPDIVVVHNSWVPGLRASLAEAPESVITPQIYSQRFYDVAAKSAIFEDKVYGLPLFYDGLVLVYNKKHFEEIDQQSAPTAWEEFRRIALALTVRGDKGQLVRSGAAIGTANNIDFFSDILGLMFSQAKVEIPGELDSKPAQDALTFYTNFAKEDKVWADSMPEASIAFVGERVSMIIVPAWNLLDIITARPDLDIGVAPVPQALPSDPVAWGSFWMTSVTSGSKNKAAAWDFLKFLAENDQELALFSEDAKTKQYGPAFASMDLKSQLDTSPYLKPVLDQASFAVSGKVAARAGNVGAVNALKDAVNAMLDTNSPAKVDEVAKVVKEKVTNTK